MWIVVWSVGLIGTCYALFGGLKTSQSQTPSTVSDCSAGGL